MPHFRRLLVLFSLFGISNISISQTWVDSLDTYTRQEYLPASHYKWTWQHAALLSVMIKQYEWGSTTTEKELYLNYIKKAMNRTYRTGGGKTPNAVASASGIAFLARVTGETKYLAKCEKIYKAYQSIRRTKEGGVSHLYLYTELWDDTVFMIGEFLLEMYKTTGDEKYLNELALQVRVHRQKLQIKEWGLWVHGWDNDTKSHCSFCSERSWANPSTRKSAEMWGRGNGWILITLSDILEYLPRKHQLWPEFSGYLTEMIIRLPELQDSGTGHWYQLPVRNKDPNNYIESSCTAMFAYGINSAIQLGLVTEPKYLKSVEAAYTGLRKYSIVSKGNKYLTVKNVCTGTCIGSKEYYFKRKTQTGRPFGLATFIQFGRRFEKLGK